MRWGHKSLFRPSAFQTLSSLEAGQLEPARSEAQAPAERTKHNTVCEMRVLSERNSVSNVGASAAGNKAYPRAQKPPPRDADGTQQQARMSEHCFPAMRQGFVHPTVQRLCVTPSLPLCTSGSSAGPTKTTALGVVQDALCGEGDREHAVHSLPQQRCAPHLGARRMTTVFKLVRRVSGRVLALPWLHLMLPSCCECECHSHMAAFPFPLKSPGWSAGTCQVALDSERQAHTASWYIRTAAPHRAGPTPRASARRMRSRGAAAQPASAARVRTPAGSAPASRRPARARPRA